MATDSPTTVDCNDDDPDINPYAAETCDDIDNDCDGLIDDEDDAVEDASSFYSDADGDGYGDQTAKPWPVPNPMASSKTTPTAMT